MNVRKEFDFTEFYKKIDTEGNTALAEMKSGLKKSHWMWYFFPQLIGLGKSQYSKYFGIKSREEAEIFLQDEKTGLFLIKITFYVYKNLKKGLTVAQIFGHIDNKKFLSCMILFYSVAKNKEIKKLFGRCKRIAEKELGKNL